MDVKRLNVNLNNETATALRALSETRGTSYTESVRVAISYLAYFHDAINAGARIMVHDRDGSTRELIL